MPRLNFSNVKEFAPLEEGSYIGRLTSVEYIAKSRTSGQPFIKLTFTLTSDNEDESLSGRKLFRNASLQEESLWAFKKYMIALGTDPEEFDEDVEVEEMARANIGNDALLVVGVKEFEDRKSNEIVDIRSADFA